MGVRDLLSAIFEKWKAFFATAVIATVGATAFGIAQAPNFRSEILILPPTMANIQTITAARTLIGPTDAVGIFDMVRQNFGSRNFQRDFLVHFLPTIGVNSDKLNYLRSSPDGFDHKTRYSMGMAIDWSLGSTPLFWNVPLVGRANIRIDVAEDKTANRPYVVVGVNWRDAQQSADLANRFAQYVDRRTAQDLVAQTRSKIEARIANLHKYLEFKEAVATKKRDHEISRIRRAAKIARELEIADPIDSGTYNFFYITPPASFFDPIDIETALSERSQPPQKLVPLYQPHATQERTRPGLSIASAPPLYLKGYRALEAESRDLQSDDAVSRFEPILIELRQELEWLEQITIDASSISTFRINQKANIPYQATSKLVWFSIVGLFVGLVAGTLVVLFLRFRAD